MQHLTDHELDTLVESVVDHASTDTDFVREMARHYVKDWNREDVANWDMGILDLPENDQE